MGVLEADHSGELANPAPCRDAWPEGAGQSWCPGVGGPASSEKAAKRCTALNWTVGPTLNRRRTQSENVPVYSSNRPDNIDSSQPRSRIGAVKRQRQTSAGYERPGATS